VTGQSVRVLVYASAPDADSDAVREAYHQISGKLRGTPGLLGNELLRSTSDPGAYVVVSQWRDLAAFQAWEEGADHRATTAPLRPLQTPGMSAGIYEVTAAYTEQAQAVGRPA
jgi:heme-degrading monooxygenase HmoA